MVLWGGWLLVTGLVFSLAQGIIHPYYTVALAPAIGAIVGIGSRFLWSPALGSLGQVGHGLHRGRELDMGRRPARPRAGVAPWLRTAILVGGCAGGVLILLSPYRERLFPARVAAVRGASAWRHWRILAGPAAYTLATVATPHSGAIPSAGPGVGRAGGFPGGVVRLGRGGAAFGRGSQAGWRLRPVAAVVLRPRPRRSAAAVVSCPRALAPVTGGRRSASRPASGGVAPWPLEPPNRQGGAGAGIGGLAQLEHAQRRHYCCPQVGCVQVHVGGRGGRVQRSRRLPVGGRRAGYGHRRFQRDGPGAHPGPVREIRKGKEDPLFHRLGFGFRGPSGAGSDDASLITSWVESHFTATTIGGVTVYDLSAGTKVEARRTRRQFPAMYKGKLTYHPHARV